MVYFNVSMDWSSKRRLMYALVVIISISALIVFLLRDTLFPKPTCFDGQTNGFELGIDCGGECEKKCTQEVIPLSVVWARALPVSSSTYDIVGLVKNSNIDNASQELGYLFTIFDEEANVITSLSGSTTAPLDGTFPIILQNQPLKKTPYKVSLTLFDSDHYKVKESPTSPTIVVTSRRYETSAEKSRLYATIANTKRLEVHNLEVRAVLFDSLDNAYAAGVTNVPYIEKEGKKDIVFLWPTPLKEEPTRIVIYPIFNPFETR